MKFLLLIFVTSSLWASKDIPQIQVQGTCEVKIIPDRGMITFVAQNESKDQKEAVTKTTEQMNDLKEAIKKLKLDDLELKNSAYSVYPVKEWEKDKMIHKGYRASLSLEVITSDIPKLGEAMMRASEIEITQVGELQTFLSLEKSREEYLKCLDIATQDAKAKAIQMGKNLDFKVGKVIYLNEVPSVFPQFQEKVFMKASSANASLAGTQIESGSQKFSTTIQVNFQIE